MVLSQRKAAKAEADLFKNAMKAFNQVRVGIRLALCPWCVSVQLCVTPRPSGRISIYIQADQGQGMQRGSQLPLIDPGRLMVFRERGYLVRLIVDDCQFKRASTHTLSIPSSLSPPLLPPPPPLLPCGPPHRTWSQTHILMAGQQSVFPSGVSPRKSGVKVPNGWEVTGNSDILNQAGIVVASCVILGAILLIGFRYYKQRGYTPVAEGLRPSPVLGYSARLHAHACLSGWCITLMQTTSDSREWCRGYRKRAIPLPLIPGQRALRFVKAFGNNVRSRVRRRLGVVSGAGSQTVGSGVGHERSEPYATVASAESERFIRK
jgi:hypothetical protein